MKATTVYVALVASALAASLVAFIVYNNNPHDCKIYRFMDDEIVWQSEIDG